MFAGMLFVIVNLSVENLQILMHMEMWRYFFSWSNMTASLLQCMFYQLEHWKYKKKLMYMEMQKYFISRNNMIASMGFRF